MSSILTAEQRKSIVVASLVSALFTALFRAMDNATVHRFIVSEDKMTAALAFLIIGAWTGVVVSFVLAYSFGRFVDPRFSGLVLTNSVMHWRAAVAGLFGAIQTFFGLLGQQYGDPGAMIALANAAVMYVVCYELAAKRFSFQIIALPAVLIFAGSSLAGFTGSLVVTAAMILLVTVASNGFKAAGEIVEQKGVQASDGVSMYLWRFLWLATAGSLLALPFAYLTGRLPKVFELIVTASASWWWFVALMVCVFFGLGLQLTLKYDNTVTVVLLATSVQVLMGYPITILGNAIDPGVFGKVSEDLAVWAVRAIGAALLLFGLWKIKQLEFQLKLKKEE